MFKKKIELMSQAKGGGGISIDSHWSYRSRWNCPGKVIKWESSEKLIEILGVFQKKSVLVSCLFFFSFLKQDYHGIHYINWPQIQRSTSSLISHVLGLNVCTTLGLGRNKCKMRTGKVHVKCSKEDFDGLHSPLCTAGGISSDSRGDPSWKRNGMLVETWFNV